MNECFFKGYVKGSFLQGSDLIDKNKNYEEAHCYTIKILENHCLIF